ncbi:hypothetical protein LTR10_010020 [Elasticomyces elasticus]|nr:hypothetical protein LTR10_010020 [Elasticomyces elasticus]KAK4970312.1 hypothetical protein LTR42_008479 [Elasticomyces elasticus]
MLALSALHLADQHTTDPDTVGRYLRLCDRHQSIAIAALRDALTAQFTPENSGAFFALAATTSVSSMARSTILAKLQQPTPFISVDEIAEALTLTKGMREVVGMTAAHTPISVMFTSYRMDSMQERYVQLPTEIFTRFAALRELCEQQCGSSGSPDAMTTPSSASSSDPSNITDTLTPCLVAVTELQDIYLNLRHFMGLSRVETGTIWRWAACLPLDFARLITARHPVALVIVAHFAATTVALRKAWYVQDWGQYALEGIERELEEGMRGWLEWPRECLKGEMGVLLTDSAIETAYADGKWRNVEQTRYQEQYVPGPAHSIFQAPAPPLWNETAWQSAITALDDATVRKLLLDATRASAPVQQAVLTKYNQKKRSEQVRVVDFSRHTNEIENIWAKYSSNSGSKEYDNAFQAAEEFEDLIRQVREEVTVHSSYGTKMAALKALREIGDDVIDCPSSCLGSEVRKHFQDDTSLAEAMCHVLALATDPELASLKADNDVLGNIRDLERSAEGYGFDMDLQSVLDVLM